MPGPQKEGDQKPPSDQDDPKNANEMDKLSARVTRLNREAEMLAVAMRQKPKK